MEKGKRKKINKLRCRKCGSGFVYVRIKDKKLVCRACGIVDEIEVNNNGG